MDMIEAARLAKRWLRGEAVEESVLREAVRVLCEAIDEEWGEDLEDRQPY